MNAFNQTVYAQSARFDGSAHALTETELRGLAPSIFAREAHHSRSERFAPIPTIDVVKALGNEGFSVVGARQSVARLDDRRDYTKHMLRLRRLDDGKKYQVGDSVFEIILKNANDGTSAYDLLAGLFRICCLNSLVAQTNEMDSLRVRHSGDVATKVVEGTYKVLANAEQAMLAPSEWPQIKLDDYERTAFAEAVHAVRFEDTTPIKPAQLLIPRRHEDQATDLWTTYNVAQENAIRGGLTARGRDANNRPRRTTTRGVNGIDQDVKLNRALFTLASKMADLKKAA